MVDTIFRFSVQKRSRIIFFFKLFYGLLILLILLGGYSSYKLDANILFFYNIASITGKFGLICYILTVIPGIARRLGTKHKLIAILMIYRRYIGITMYLSVFCHYIILRGANIVRNNLPKEFPPAFEFVGMIALFLTFFLFLTSNDFFVIRLKKWWNYIHRLTYVIIWFIAFHLLLQRISIWSVLISVTVIIQLTSFFYNRMVETLFNKKVNL